MRMLSRAGSEVPGENGTSSEGKGLNFDSSLTDSAEPVTVVVSAPISTNHS